MERVATTHTLIVVEILLCVNKLMKRRWRSSAMDLLLNKAKPLIMHIDLNSCFATIEQQANPLYRRKPLAVAAYDTPRGMIIAWSYEAKAIGIKLGINVAKARTVHPRVIIVMRYQAKYHEALRLS